MGRYPAFRKYENAAVHDDKAVFEYGCPFYDPQTETRSDEGKNC